MPDAVDVYADQFQINIGPYGCTFNFMLSSHQPPAPGTVPQAQRMASVRMSLEHTKVMAYLIQRQIKEYERQTGVHVQLPQDVLNGLRIGREDWDGFWRRGDEQ
jgi:hypothetical protein